MSIDPELRLLLEWENEAARWRRRALFLLAVVLHGLLAILLAVSPRFFHFASALVAENVEPAPKRESTILYFPQNLAKRLRQPPPKTNILSDKNRIAQGRAPVVNPHGLRAPYMRGNSHLPELAGGGHPPKSPPTPPPTPPQQAANQHPSPPNPPAPKKEEPKQEAQLHLMDVRPPSAGGVQPKITLPVSTPGEAIQHSLEAAAQARSSGAAVGPGDSTAQFQNLNPNFSTAGPIILSDTRGVNFGPYLARVVYIVRRNWYAVIPESARLGEKGRVGLVFEILKDGSVPQLRLVASSGSNALDLAALASIRASNPFPPLPSEFTGKHLVLEFIYLYNLSTQY